QTAIPVAGLHCDLIAERAYQFFARRRRQAAELDRGAVAADRIETRRLLRRQDPDDAVKIRQPLVVVIRVALAPDRLARLVADQLEGARTHNVFLVPARVAVEDLLLVDPGVGIGERRQKSAGRKFETEHHGQRVRHLDLVDHDVEALTRAGDAFRRTILRQLAATSTAVSGDPS